MPSKANPKPKGAGAVLPGVSFVIPSNVDTNLSYLAAMFGLPSTDALRAQVLIDHASKPVLSQYADLKNNNFNLKATPPLHLEKLWGQLQDPNFFRPIDEPLPITPDKIGATEYNEQTFYTMVMISAANLIKAIPTMFQNDQGELLGPFHAESWAKAVCVLKTYARLVTGSRGSKGERTSRNAPASTLIAARVDPPTREGSGEARPVTAVTALDHPSADLADLFNEYDPDEESSSEEEGADGKRSQKERRPLTEDEINDNIAAFEATIETLDTVSLGKRPLLTQQARDHIVNGCARRLKILSDEPIKSDFIDSQQTLDADGKDVLIESDSSSNHQADVRAFWELQRRMNDVSNIFEPPHSLACDILQIDPITHEVMIAQPAGPPVKWTARAWQVIGSAWMRLMEDSALRSCILADDCGVGKTRETLLHIFRDYTDGVEGRREAPFRPTLIVAPTVVVQQWYQEIKACFGNAMRVRIWHGQKSEVADAAMAADTLGTKPADLLGFVGGLEPKDPMTAVTVVLTSYTTGYHRALLADGQPCIGSMTKLRAQRKQAREAAAEDDDDENGGEVVKGVNYTTVLEGKFARVVCDEAHKIKNRMTLTHKFIECIRPRHFNFLSATPMANVTGDLLGFLSLIWRPELEPDRLMQTTDSMQMYLDARSALAAISERPAPMTAVTAPSILACIHPDIFKSMLRGNALDTNIAPLVLRVIMSIVQLRRVLASSIALHDGTTVTIGAAIPPYTITTVELAFPRAQRERYRRIHQLYAGRLHRASAEQGGEFESGAMNNNFHRRLNQAVASVDLETVCDVLGKDSKVHNVNRFHHRREFDDHGMTHLFKLIRGDKWAPVYRTRGEMVVYLSANSPKLQYTMRYVNEKVKLGQRTLIFTEWPLVQWKLEGVLSLLGFHVRSIRSAHSIALRNKTVADFNDPNKNIDALVCSFKTTAFGLNIQKVCHNVIHFELPTAMAVIQQSNGRVHRLGQTEEQDIKILTIDASYDLPIQHRIASKYLPLLTGMVSRDGLPRLPDESEEMYEDRFVQLCATLLARHLGQRASRLKCDNLRDPYSFERYPPGTDTQAIHVPVTPKRQRYINPIASKSLKADGLDKADDDEPSSSMPLSTERVVEEDLAADESGGQLEDGQLEDGQLEYGQHENGNAQQGEDEQSEQSGKRNWKGKGKAVQRDHEQSEQSEHGAVGPEAVTAVTEGDAGDSEVPNAAEPMPMGRSTRSATKRAASGSDAPHNKRRRA